MISLVSRGAAKHSALWSFDRWYRLSWYIAPLSLAILICGWGNGDKPMDGASSSNPWAKIAVTPRPSGVPSAVQPWPSELNGDVTTCFAKASDLVPLIEACSKIIVSRRLDNAQLALAYGQRGFLQSSDSPDQALVDYDAALKVQADLPVKFQVNVSLVLTNRAWIYMIRGQFDAALEDLNKAIQLAQPWIAARARNYRGYTLFKMQDYDRAMMDLNESIGLDPDGPDAYLARGEVEQAKQLYESALRDFDQFSRRVPWDARGLVGRATVLESTGRRPEALQAYADALARDPTNAEILEARARLRAAQDSSTDRAGKDDKH